MDLDQWYPTRGLLEEAVTAANLSVGAQIDRALTILWTHSKLVELAVGLEPDGVVRLYAKFEAGLLEAGKNGRGYVSLWPAGDDDAAAEAFEAMVAKMREVARDLPHCEEKVGDEMFSLTYSEQE